ncbi:MAG: hypothetical protein M1812_005893 [Candelaria pacifica]|nr:MAG: hypothetical protein M1812_005893 [Candelaria pacifica]
MPPLSSTYLLPALFLNPVLFLHGVNTILSRALPPIPSDFPTPPLSNWGPEATLPHLDLHASDNLCWSYTVFIVGVQLVAFGRVSQRREGIRERKEELRLRKEAERMKINGGGESENRKALNGIANGNGKLSKEITQVRLLEEHADDTGWDETDDEMML